VAESLAGVVLTQQVLAHIVGRERPNGEDELSFPSGHTSWAFASTTLIVRGLHDPADDSFHLVDGLLYMPALFSSWERIANDKHFPSDVAAGAFLGVFLTNWIWDAHYRSEDESRGTVFEHARPRGIVWSPYVGEVDGQIVLGFKGEF
jgi:membrane-associated phospholipid phosphatase